MVDIAGRLHKHALSRTGEVLRDYDALTTPTVDQNVVYQSTSDALKAKEGCRIEGQVEIHKVPGNFHISSHKFPNAYQKLFYNNE